MTTVYKLIFLAVLFSCFAFAETAVPPRPSGPVADYAGIIDADTEMIINSLARKLWLDTDFGLMVVTVATLGNEPVELFIRKLCTEWHVWKKNNPEGAVVLVTGEPSGWHIVPGNGSRSYLDSAGIAGLMQLTEENEVNGNGMAERLVLLVNRLSATIYGAKRLSSDKGPSEVVSEQQHVALEGWSPFLGFSPSGIALVIAFTLTAIILVTVVSRKRHSIRTRKREPFGNVLSGEGFGGSMLRK